MTITGTGCPIPDAERAGPGVLVDVDGLRLQFDAGRSTVQRLAAAGLPYAEIDAVFDLLDPDKSGKIDYQELDKSIRRINQERKGAKEEAKKEAMEKQLKRQNTAKPESLQKRK